jgi:AcrR family transcriptional regulator
MTIKDKLQEMISDDGVSTSIEPVDGAGGKVKPRLADKFEKVPTQNPPEEDTPEGNAVGKKAPARLADKKEGVDSVKESIEAMFAGSDLSEEFKENATTIFEAAVSLRLKEEIARLEEEYEEKYKEEAASVVESLSNSLDEYLNYVAEQWMEENKLAIERGIRNEIAESFLSGLKNLFVEHNVHIEDEEVDIISEMALQLEETEAALNESEATNAALTKKLDEAKIANIFESHKSGLTETQAEKLLALSEGIEYSNSEEYARKLKVIKESYFGGKKVLTESNDLMDPLEESAPSTKKILEPGVAAYVDAISRAVRK